MTTTYKVAELEGALLDAAVAMADGRAFDMRDHGHGSVCFASGMQDPFTGDVGPFSPSTKDADGGPIIDREKIATEPVGSTWCAAIALCSVGDVYGPTRLISAMRLYVASKFGDTIDL